jgi:hypothetical protein
MGKCCATPPSGLRPLAPVICELGSASPLQAELATASGLAGMHKLGRWLVADGWWLVADVATKCEMYTTSRYDAVATRRARLTRAPGHCTGTPALLLDSYLILTRSLCLADSYIPDCGQ